MSSAIKFENISKQYRLGLVSTQTISHDLNRWWQTSIRGKEDPYLKIGDVNDRSTKAESDYVWALKDINFEVQQGDVLGIIGKNGSGKSTLLKILSKITAPTTGTIHHAGRIAALLEVGTGFHPEMTGRENIYLNGAILGMTKTEIKSKLDEIIDFSGIERYIDTPAKRYSSGMYVRLGFAIAAHLDPEIMIVDEVLAVGDAEFQKKAIGKMQNISKGEGRTVLFVSHNMGAVETLCNKGLVLENGKISFSGLTGESISYYLSTDSLVSGRILDGIKYCHSALKIQAIKINGLEKNIVYLDNKESILKFEIEGEAFDDKKMSFGLVIYDYRDVKLAICSPGHVIGKTHKLKKGQFIIEETVHLPNNITKGEYRLDISLHEPNIEMFLEAPNCVKLITKGVIGLSGLEFEYRDNGFLILK